jgi:hypothetical protein
MNSREWEYFQRTVLGDRNVSLSTDTTADKLLGLGGKAIVQGLDYSLNDPLTSTSTLLSTPKPTTIFPALTDTIAALAGINGNSEQRHNTLLSKAFGFAPLIRGLFSLFHRDDTNETPLPIRFSLPAPFRTEAAFAADSFTFNIDRGMGDRIRPLRGLDRPVPPVTPSNTGSPPMSTPVNNITVQVNAIDSRSFLDHSEDIARAVRDAMLHSHALNDVVNDL